MELSFCIYVFVKNDDVVTTYRSAPLEVDSSSLTVDVFAPLEVDSSFVVVDGLDISCSPLEMM